MRALCEDTFTSRRAKWETAVGFVCNLIMGAM